MTSRAISPAAPVTGDSLRDRLYRTLEAAEGISAVLTLVIDGLERGESDSRAVSALRLALGQQRHLVATVGDLHERHTPLTETEAASATQAPRRSPQTRRQGAAPSRPPRR